MGNGKSISIGVDPIAGLNSVFVLPEYLRAYLEDYGISSLAYAHYWGTGDKYCLTAEDLDLDGSWKELWTNYINGLSHGCIRIVNNIDTLVWMYIKRMGQVTG